MFFARNPGCVNCDLHKTCKTVCIPSRYFGSDPVGPDGLPLVRKERALIFIGEAPKGPEDHEGICWIGPPGQLLNRLYIRDVFKFHEKADIYVSTVVRCKHPTNDTPSPKQQKACRQYLETDLKALEAIYSEVWVVCCGATAAKFFGFKSLTSALKVQGDPQELPDGR